MEISRRAFAALSATVLAVALSSCTPEEPEPTPTATPSPTPTWGSAERPLGPGTAVTGSGWRVTVNSVVMDASAAVAAANPFNPTPEEGQKYVLVNATLKRTGSTAAYPFAVDISLLTSDGALKRPSNAQPPSRLDLLAEMQPQAEVTGNIAYLVPAAEEAVTVSVTPGEQDNRAFVHVKP